MTVVGVTGHRVLTDQASIVHAIRAAFDRIRELHPGEPLTILSALAEGSDRLVAREALKRTGDRLIVVLPLPKADYIRDFHSTESRAEFEDLLAQANQVVELGSSETRDAAYEAVGNYVVDNSQAMIAIWDGKNAQGGGGTGNVVARARRLGRPIAWIKAGNRIPATTEPTSLGTEQGRLTLENF